MVRRFLFIVLLGSVLGPILGTGTSMAAALYIDPADQVLDIVDQFVAHSPLGFDQVRVVSGIAVKASGRKADDGSDIYEGADPQWHPQIAKIAVRQNKSAAHAMIVSMTIASDKPCISLDQIKARYPMAAAPQRAHAAFSHSYNFPWGALTFQMSENDACLQDVSFDYQTGR